MKVLCSDLDGTLAKINHRLHHVQKKPPDWNAFNKAIPHDTLNEGVALTVRAWADAGYTIVLCSGRSEDTRQMTEDWLDDHDIPYSHLFMRKSGDYRKDNIIKQEILDMMQNELALYPVFVLDDRPQVVQMWRDNGIMVGQVADWRPDPIRGRFPPSLHVLIGPTGAGKSTWTREFNAMADMVVSSDSIRAQLTGDMLDQSMNDQVFTALHAVVKQRLDMGLTTFVDATNIRRKDRLAVRNLADSDVRVIYHVFNRPMEEKVRDGGWRNDVPGLLERHENTFTQNLKWILDGDGDPDVTVIDHREET